MNIYRTALMAVTAMSVVCAQATQRPNIIIIYADDMGWDGPSCYGNTYHETPHIDQMANDGMLFTQAYSGGPVCAPSRAVLMSGQYVSRHGLYRVNQVDTKHPEARATEPPLNITNLDLGIITMADSLNAAGYATAYCGKWHLGHEGEYLPEHRGFERALTTRSPSGTKRYFFPKFSTLPPKEFPKGTYMTDVVTDFATSFIHEKHERPFFMYLPYFNVHGPYEAKPERIKYYQEKDPSRSELDAIYAAMHSHFDDAVGAIQASLKEQGLLENTLVIFTADNGATTKFMTCLRGGKSYLYEGGIRVPMIATWPGTIPPNTQFKTPVHQADFYPTFLELAQANIPDQPLDGASIVSVLQGKDGPALEDRALFWHYPTYMKYDAKKKRYEVTPCSAMRQGKWKLVNYFTSDRPADRQIELYNIEADPKETKDLARKNPERAQRMLKQLQTWRTETGAPMPEEK